MIHLPSAVMNSVTTATKAEQIRNFDPRGIGLDNGNFGGLPFTFDTADIVLLPVPWEVTVSYNPGTAAGPQMILDASRQLDLYDLDNPNGWQQGIWMAPVPADLQAKSDALRQEATQIIEHLEQGGDVHTDPDLTAILERINQACKAMNQSVMTQAQTAIATGKRVGVIGGDHSVPLGNLRAIATRYPEFGVLHFDAHADLRQAYEGFQYSHASIMYNALDIPQLTMLVQVGIRDISQEEVTRIQQSNGRVVTYYDAVLQEKLYSGQTWLAICEQIVDQLPRQVYVSFDVDGLDPKLCPHTGTPVPGGMELEQAFCLLRTLVRSGKTIIGFDVCETGAAEWDGNVAARVVYKLCNLMGLNA